MKKLQKYARLLIMGLFVVGFGLTMGGWMWLEMQTDQTTFYDRGLVAYVLGSYDLAIKDFDLSLADYNMRVNSLQGPTAAPASLEQAELAQEHKALALVKMKQTKPAVLAYKECLRLTTDVYMGSHPVLPGVDNPDLVKAAYAKIKDDGRDCAVNLEILWHQQQQQADAEGKGSGQQGNGSPKDGDQSSEDPSNSAGKMSRDNVND